MVLCLELEEEYSLHGPGGLFTKQSVARSLGMPCLFACRFLPIFFFAFPPYVLAVVYHLIGGRNGKRRGETGGSEVMSGEFGLKNTSNIDSLLRRRWPSTLPRKSRQKRRPKKCLVLSC